MHVSILIIKEFKYLKFRNVTHVFILIVIYFKTVSGSSWTESIKNETANHTRVNAADALSYFTLWSYIGSDLPGHDHAMLFTKYVYEPFKGVQKRGHLRKYCKLCNFHTEKLLDWHNL